MENSFLLTLMIGIVMYSYFDVFIRPAEGYLKWFSNHNFVSNNVVQTILKQYNRLVGLTRCSYICEENIYTYKISLIDSTIGKKKTDCINISDIENVETGKSIIPRQYYVKISSNNSSFVFHTKDKDKVLNLLVLSKI